jgi:NAD-dependent SIR2 family protein deacetylase
MHMLLKRRKLQMFSSSSEPVAKLCPHHQFLIKRKKNDKKVIEVNIKPSNYTDTITDVFLKGKATEVVPKLMEAIRLKVER